jgi:uncharacterized paraquat-inducible protein A
MDINDGRTQGKCPKCKVAFRFDHPAHLYDAYCPDCRTKLVRTSYLFKGPWRIASYCLPPTGLRMRIPVSDLLLSRNRS